MKSKEDDLVLLRKENNELREQAKGDNLEILKMQNIELQKKLEQLYLAMDEKRKSSHLQIPDDTNEINEFLKNNYIMQYFPRVIEAIQHDEYFGNIIPSDVIAYLEANNLITKRGDSTLFFDYTEKGKEFLKAYTNQRVR